YSATLDLTALNDMLPVLNAHIPREYRPPPPAAEHPPSISPDSIFSGAPEAKQVLMASSDPAIHFKRMTMLPLLLKTLSLAMMEWPVMRTHINPTTEPSAKPNLTVRPSADISIGLSTPTGLYTPTLVGLNTHSPYVIAGSLARLAYLGRQTPSGLTPADMPKRGGTLTVSNVGAIGAGKWAVPRLVQGGGVAIVAIGRAEWVVKPSGEKRLEVGVSWSADHRIVEGAELAAFVESWRSWVENPARLVGVGRYTLIKNDYRNTTLTDPDDNIMYKISTIFKFPNEITTITRGDDLDVVAVIHWNASENNTITMNGITRKVNDVFPKPSKWSTTAPQSSRLVTTEDGEVFKWKYTLKLYCMSENTGLNVATYYHVLFANLRSAKSTIDIAPSAVQHSDILMPHGWLWNTMRKNQVTNDWSNR
ncbi:CoA-dependent acyltransferase, partial [Rhizoctonia solani]